MRIQVNGQVNVIFSGANILSTASGTIALNTVYHIVVMSGTTGTFVYINGVLSASNSTAWPGTGASTSYIGVDTTSAQEIWDGNLSNVAVYISLLTATQIANHYNAGINDPAPTPTPTPTITLSPSLYAPTILADGPVGYWHLGEASGTVAADSSGNGHTGTYSGTYTQGNTSLLPHGYGKCIQSAAAAWISIQSGWISSVSSNISLECWFKPEDFSNAPALLCTYTGGFGLGMNSGGYLDISDPGVTNLATDTTLLVLGTIYYVVATWSSTGVINFYINGVLSSTSTGHGAAPAGVDPFTLMNYDNNSGGNYLNGNIQEVAIYNKVLTATQIANHYAAA